MSGSRSHLLPPYLDSNPVWTEFLTAADDVFTANIDGPTKDLLKLRHPYVIPKETEEKIAARDMLNFSDFDIVEKSLIIRQVNLLGMALTNSSLLTEEDYLRVYRNLAKFWYSKGTDKFIDFIGFCLNASFSLKPLWSNSTGAQLTNLKQEGDPAIGSPVYEGGTWYPTTLVDVSFDVLKFSNVTIAELVRFFYEFANADLVLNSIEQTGTMYIGDNPAAILGMAGLVHNKVTLKSWEDTPIVVHMHLNGIQRVHTTLVAEP